LPSRFRPGRLPWRAGVYALALGIEFFIASGSAKAFLMMPIILPLADLIGVTRQTAVLAYIFGDGFSNLAYPTNPVLLICLGLTVVSYPKWLRWTAKLWLWVILATVVFLGIAVAINYGPFLEHKPDFDAIDDRQWSMVNRPWSPKTMT
jgi:Mg2+/citrate symporter